MNTISTAKPRGGNGMDGGDILAAADEPGVYDNRISLVPADFPVTKNWRDGGIYSLSELGGDVKIRQISPGEFELIPGMAEADSETELAEATPEVDSGKNPVIEDMLAGYRA